MQDRGQRKEEMREEACLFKNAQRIIMNTSILVVHHVQLPKLDRQANLHLQSLAGKEKVKEYWDSSPMCIPELYFIQLIFDELFQSWPTAMDTDSAVIGFSDSNLVTVDNIQTMQ